MSREQVVPKRTATQMVMVRQVKMDAPHQNKLEKDFDKNWEGQRRHFAERCDRRAFDEAWEMLSDAYKDAFLKQQNERIDEKKTAGQGREPRFVREPVCQKPTPGFMGEVDMEIRKRKQLIDQIRSMRYVWKKMECVDFGVEPWELGEERWNKVR